MLILIAIIFFTFALENESHMANERFVKVADIVLGYSLYLWYRSDSRSSSDRATFRGIVDIGLFIFQVGFLIIPYHLVNTRKRRGWLSLGITLAVVIFATIGGAILGKALD